MTVGLPFKFQHVKYGEMFMLQNRPASTPLHQLYMYVATSTQRFVRLIISSFHFLMYYILALTLPLICTLQQLCLSQILQESEIISNFYGMSDHCGGQGFQGCWLFTLVSGFS